MAWQEWNFAELQQAAFVESVPPAIARLRIVQSHRSLQRRRGTPRR
jgi:hypothetical protein